MKNRTRIYRITLIALLSALATVLMTFRFLLPLAPTFLEFDISELPALFAGFFLGPGAGCLVILIKNLLHPMMTPQSENAPKSQNHILSWTGTPNLGMKLMRKLMKENQKIAQTKGAEFFFDTKALRLEKADSRVSAVLCRLPDGDIIRIRAKKGILLAAGDYSRNRQMCEDLLTETADLVDGGDFTGHGWTGDGIRMGVWAGGRLEPRSHAGMGGNYSFPGFDTIGSTATLRLNTHGERYSNEGFGNHVMAALTLS